MRMYPKGYPPYKVQADIRKWNDECREANEYWQ